METDKFEERIEKDKNSDMYREIPKSKIITGILIFSGLIIALVLLAKLNTSSVGTVTTSPLPSDEAQVVEMTGTASEPTIAETPTATIGQTVNMGPYAVKVTGVKKTKSVGGATTDETFVVVSVTVKNTGNESIGVDSDYFTLVDSNGRKFDASQDVKVYYDQTFMMDKINPGLSRSANVAFEVPKDSSGFTLDVRDSLVDSEYAERAEIKLNTK
ncbi:hypothetical protein PPSQR21_031990 [Paenibacillus polymyxa SQR-21]|uniref:DUF4352 domain-containing protein n=1 Tax=Paenibacillus polymyxa TaxID=1406 RepID=UPI00042F254B|nr:DUF4352 domain-containing protein [Paenibacillus polymyxa]AHM66838.1 hypothetical protein PPSQR21_031990 [Paenibacillus polymyxa SQR-21]